MPVLSIDGRRVEAREGETILECALRHSISIPHLCTHPDLPPFGACRLCLVEIDGMRGYPASCTTPAAQDMVVRTDTDPLRRLRRQTLELILLEHPSACLVCDKSELCERYRPKAQKAGRTTGCHTCNNKEVCEVRVLSHDLGVHDLPVAPRYRGLTLERSDPFIDRDLNLCILCGRCVRICKAHQGETVIDFVGRGSRTRIGEAFGRSLSEALCRFCGSCVDVCPTGSLADRYGKWHGAADAQVETTCGFCEAGCALKVASIRGRVAHAGAIGGGTPICVLGRFALPGFLNHQARLRAPRIRAGNVLRDVPWERALADAAQRLAAFRDGRFALVCDASGTLEDRHLFKRFVREVMRSEHYIEAVPDARGRAHAGLPDGVAAALLAGPFVRARELEQLDLLIVGDCYPSEGSERAHVIFPSAVFAEVEGTLIDGGGRLRPLRPAGKAPGEARPDWRIISDLARAMGAEGFGYASAADLATELGRDGAELLISPSQAPPAALDARKRRTHYRGHAIEERVGGLRSLPAPESVLGGSGA